MFREKPSEHAPRRESRSREALLTARIKDLQLHLAGTPLESMIQQMYRELEARGMDLRPTCYLSDEWGCPSLVPAIGIPFYLADPELHGIERELGGSLETEEECLMYLRHEAGHVFNYAYKLHEQAEWRQLFGDFDAPYRDNYKAKPYSRKYVTHIAGWYAQKHADEDFAETFGVWLTPGMDWRKRYAGWGALKKLEYVDRLAKALGRQPPLVVLDASPLDEDASAMEATVQDHYRQRQLDERIELQLGEALDGELAELFWPPGAAPAQAETLIAAERQNLVQAVSHTAGVSQGFVRALVDHLESRAAALRLTVKRDEAIETMTALTALVCTLTMNHLYTDRFFEE
jgi:hypothetical protein